MSHEGQGRQAPRELKTRYMVWVVIVGIFFVAVVLAVLIPIAMHNDARRAAVWVDIITRSLAVFAGVAGGFALWLAFRRQQVIEQQHRDHLESVRKEQEDRDRQHEQRESANRVAEHDAAQRRMAELRIQAVEQLGSDKAPVRIGGLNNLELLGELNPELRQLVLNEICAYLRMPYAPPSKQERTQSNHQEESRVSEETTGKQLQEAHQEQQVRLTAQRILSRRLSDDEVHYWEHDSIDLSGAYLEALNFSACRIINAQFTYAYFDGEASFTDTVFEVKAGAHQASSLRDGLFVGATFQDSARFDGSTFKGHAKFRSATFLGSASFENTTFANDAVFSHATFHRSATFDRADFNDNGWWYATTYHSYAWFEGAQFRRKAWLDNAIAILDPHKDTDDPDGSHDLPSNWDLVPIPSQPGYGQLVDREQANR